MGNAIEFVNYDERMQIKLDECNLFLNGKDAAIERRDLARAELEAAEAALAEYDDMEYVEKVTAYRDYLKQKLGIVDVVEDVAEAHDEQQVIENESAPVVEPEFVAPLF